jgi:uncharacterized glyoxalase superfamily protein PhnB
MSTKPGSTFDTGTRAEPQKLRLRSLGISITANDFQKSLAWYRDVMGFHVERNYERDGKVVGASLVAGEARISLNQDDGKKGLNRAKGQGMRLYLNTGQDIDDIAARVQKAGGKLDAGPADYPWGVRAFSITDPDGFALTVSRPLQE